MHTKISPAAFAIAMTLTRGCYQRAILRGTEAWSGATLAGKAAQYGAHYARSRKSLAERMRRAGLVVDVEVGARGKRILTVCTRDEAEAMAWAVAA